MLRVVDLLALPSFEKFKLISNADGLFNKVSSISILEWESPEDVLESFLKDDIVFAPMFMAPEQREKAFAGIKASIELRVAAVAIKLNSVEEFDQNPDLIPKDLIDMANLYKIPIFIYAGTYIEEVVYVVRKALIENDSNRISLNSLRDIMHSTQENMVTNTMKLNPLFFNNIVSICCIPAKIDSMSELEVDRILDEALNTYRRTLPHNIQNTNYIESVIRCTKSVLIIHSARDQVEEPSVILSRCNIDCSSFTIGISEEKHSLLEIKDSVDESIAAAIDAMISKEKFKEFREVGFNGLILSAMNTNKFTEFYYGTYNVLHQYDESHSSNLLETLISYIDSDWDINLTSRKLYQHSNTIRYRLDKIRKLLGYDSGPDGQLQLAAFVFMHKTYVALNGWSVI